MNGWLRAAVVLVALQGLFFAGWIWSEASLGGREIRVELRPVDPRDLLRGQYLALSYAMEDADAYQAGGVPLASSGRTVYVALRRSESDREVFVPVYHDLSREALLARLAEAEPAFDGEVASPASDWVLVKGRVQYRGRFEFGINRYYVPEGSPEPPRNARTLARLRVSERGTPRLLGLDVDGVPWPPSGPGRGSPSPSSSEADLF